MADCIFCKIAAGEIPSSTVYEDELVRVIRDINPQAPTHLLVLPKKHMDSVAHAQSEDQALLGHMLLTAANVARSEGIAEDGYRLVINTGSNGAQSVAHLHLHILGGKALSGMMG